MLDFPSDPIPGQKYTAKAGLTYGFDGVKWTTMSGSATTAAPSSSDPLMDGDGEVGGAVTYARGDHVHPTDTGRGAINNSYFTGTLSGEMLQLSGNLTVYGSINSTMNGHRLGDLGGIAATGAVTKADANIILHDAGTNNWIGIGADADGNVWLRTGISGTPAPLMYVQGSDQVIYFRDPPTAPTPAASDNSNKIATTSFVMNRSGGGSYLPLAGGTITGALLHNAPAGNGNDDLRTWRSDGTGVIYMNQAGTRYLYNNNAGYHLASASAIANNGRLYGSSDFGAAYCNARLAFVADRNIQYNTALEEPYGGSTITGAGGVNPGGPMPYRYRQFQYFTSSWFAIGYA